MLVDFAHESLHAFCTVEVSFKKVLKINQKPVYLNKENVFNLINLIGFASLQVLA